MPILWRYLIVNYLNVFGLCVVAFIAILLTSRLEEIAHFASFGAELHLIVLFTLFQIPYILPIAIPISCLISSILLMQRLSAEHELTAIRSSGFSLKEIVIPILLTSAALSFLNFFIVSELATWSHFKTNLLKTELRSVNPLLLLHNKHLMRMKGIYYDTMGPSRMGQSAADVIIGMPNQHTHSINLILAKNLLATTDRFHADQLGILSQFGESTDSTFDELMLENIAVAESKIEDFAYLIQKKVSHVTHDNLNMRLLLLRLDDLRLQLTGLENNPASEPVAKQLRKSIRMLYTDIARRLSGGLSPFTLTLLGLAFGMSIGRGKKKGTLAFPLLLAAFYLMCFFAAKALENQVGLAIALYILPQLIIIILSIRKMDRISHGVE